MIRLKMPMVTKRNRRMYANMKTPPLALRRCSCKGVPSKAAQPSVKHRKQVNMAAGTDANSSRSLKSVRLMMPSKYMQSTSSTTAQKSTRRPVNTPWIMSFNSWKILNFNRRMIRPRRANFSIFSVPRKPPPSSGGGVEVAPASCTAAMPTYVMDMSKMARTTQAMSNQLQYQSDPNKYVLQPNTLSLTRISPMKKAVKTISKIAQTSWSGSMSADKPATAALSKMTHAGMMSKSRRKVAFSSDSSSSSSTLAFTRFPLGDLGTADVSDGNDGSFNP
mmetsp:Transcript_29283/g.67944  ORF Transcript_29283/g.67944 Transcript_29283/m.67944 type:complete len:277 (-) Transcript_29283:191-1021(-)